MALSCRNNYITANLAEVENRAAMVAKWRREAEAAYQDFLNAPPKNTDADGQIIDGPLTEEHERMSVRLKDALLFGLLSRAPVPHSGQANFQDTLRGSCAAEIAASFVRDVRGGEKQPNTPLCREVASLLYYALGGEKGANLGRALRKILK
jgi:hypothetical protein